MGPVFTDLRNKSDGRSVLFVTLDFTNKTTSHQAEMTIGALGMQAYEANRGTGFIFLLDGKTRGVLHRMTSELSLKDMGVLLEEALNR